MSLIYKGSFLKYHFNTISSILKSKQVSSSISKYATSYLYYCTGPLPEKKFHSNENNFARSVMEKTSGYNMMLSNPSTDCVPPEEAMPGAENNLLSPQSDMPIEELFKLAEVAIYRNSQSLDGLFEILNAVKMRCHEMDDDKLASVLKGLKHSSFFESQKKDQLTGLWKELDNVCVERWKTWTLPKVFYFMDLWCALGLFKKSDFVYYATIKFLRKPGRLSPQQVVQLLFYLNIMRHTAKKVSMFDLECKLEECIQELSLEEIGVASMGFFKTENVIHGEKTINHIIDKTIDGIKTVPEITLACILKVLRNSMKVKLWHRIPELLNAIEPELPRFTITSSVHVSLLLTKGQILHENVLRKVSQKLVDNIMTCRLKDMEKAVFPLSQLNFDPETEPCIYRSILNELNKEERQAEIMGFPKAFIALIHNLCLKGTYDENLIKKILNMEFIHHAYGKDKYMFGREVLYIDTTVELECPSYEGPRLPENIRNYLSKRYSEYLPNPKRKMTKHHLLHNEIKETAETVFGKDCVVEKYLLPNHPRGDIVVNFDRDQQPLPIDRSLKNRELFNGPVKAHVGSNYCALVVGSINMFLYKSKVPNGETVSKLKQLRLLGYSPVLVPYDEWPSNDTLEKIRRLKTLISLEIT